jgi:hypothetical protein
MIVSHGGVQSDVSEDRLPADAIPAIGAYSLNRKLRKLYNGQYFRYRQASGGEFDFPANQPNFSEDVFVVKIYDQKAKNGVSNFDASQPDPMKQPALSLVGSHYEAVFNNSEYIDIPGIASILGRDFTITTRGNGGSVPTPMIGVWGGVDEVTLEPSDIATRFTYNSNLGTIADSDGQTIQCFSGEDSKQNGNRVISINGKFTSISSSQTGDVNVPSTSSNFSYACFGRSNTRHYVGTLSESTFHLSDLTQIGAEQIFLTMRNYYGN